ncbi:hypothetical protein Tco_0645418, partial [Tanacetum coccineum]
MTGGLLRGTPGDNIGATPTGITENVSGSTSGGPLEINVKTPLDGAVLSAREQIEGHLSALRSLLKEHNGRGNASPTRLSFDDTEDQPRVQTVVTGTIVDADLKKPFKEAVKTPMTRRIIEFAGPKFKMPANIRLYDGATDPEDHLSRAQDGRQMMTRLDDFVRSEEAFASTELPKGEVSEASKKSMGLTSRREDRFYGCKDLFIKGLTSVSTIKLPILKKGEYDIWAMKMEHYLAHTDYQIWEVIQNGNGPVSITTDTSGQIKVLPPRTAEEIVARKRERKARTTLLMALPEDHLAKFHKMTDAKEMCDAIKSRFGGNDKSKKMQKYILKQQFEGFSVSNTEGLHKGYDRFQSLLSLLEIHGAGVSIEDAIQKFLRSLPSAWSQVSLIMRTKPGVDSLSFD